MRAGDRRHRAVEAVEWRPPHHGHTIEVRLCDDRMYRDVEPFASLVGVRRAFQKNFVTALRHVPHGFGTSPSSQQAAPALLLGLLNQAFRSGRRDRGYRRASPERVRPPPVRLSRSGLLLFANSASRIVLPVRSALPRVSSPSRLSSCKAWITISARFVRSHGMNSPFATTPPKPVRTGPESP